MRVCCALFELEHATHYQRMRMHLCEIAWVVDSMAWLTHSPLGDADRLDSCRMAKCAAQARSTELAVHPHVDQLSTRDLLLRERARGKGSGEPAVIVQRGDDLEIAVTHCGHFSLRACLRACLTRADALTAAVRSIRHRRIADLRKGKLICTRANLMLS